MSSKTRFIALIVSVVMLIGVLPLSLFAVDTTATAAEENTVTLEGINVTLGAETALNYYITADEAAISELTANFAVGESIETVKLSNAEKTATGVKVSVGLSSIELAKNIIFTLTDADGVAVEFATATKTVTSYEYSVKKYASSLIASNNTAETKAAAKSLLLYGYFAETYFAGEASTSFDDVLTPEDIAAVSGKAFGEGNAEVSNVIVGDSNVLGVARLVLDSYAKIRIEVKGTEVPVVESDDAEVDVVNVRDKYHVDLLGIMVSDFNTVYTFTVNGTTVRISLLAVANVVASNTSTYSDAFVNLAKALYHYYDSTNDYKIAESSKIVYEVNGGALPADAPAKYDSETGVLLPNDVTRDGYVFGGWYANADFSSERMHYVAAGTSGAVTVYAKWLRAVVDEDYETVNITGAGTVEGVVYNTFKFSINSAVGNKYLAVNLNANAGTNIQGSIAVKNHGNIKDSGESVVSYEMSLGKIADLPLPPTLEIQVPSNTATVLSVNSDGDIYLKNGTKKLGSVTEAGLTKVRFAVDYVNKTVTAYDSDNDVIEKVTVSNIPLLSSISVDYHMFFYIRKSQTYTELGNTGFLFDDLRIVEGDIFEKAVTELPASNEIVYDAGIGTLSQDAPTTYNSSVDTALPVLEKSGYVFAGWYTDSAFNASTRIEKIAAGTKGTVQLYARWYFVAADEDYETTVVTGANKFNGIQYNNQSNASFTMGTSDGGNKYLSVVLDSNSNVAAQANVMVKDNGVIVSSPVVCYEMSFAKIAGVDLTPVIELQLPLVNGGSSATIFKVTTLNDGTGEIKLNGGTKVIGTIKEGVFDKVRIAVDFDNKTATAYDENYDVIETVTISALPALSAINRQYHMFLYTRKPGDSALAKTGYLLDDIKIVEGMIFE